MSAAFYRLRPASPIDSQEQQKIDQSQATQSWQSATLPSSVNIDAPAETVNLSRFEASCRILEHEVKENIVYRAGCIGTIASCLINAILCIYCILFLNFTWDAVAAVAHILVLPWVLCALTLHAPRYYISIMDVLRECCSWTYIPSVWTTARTILCLQATFGRESPKFVDISTALCGAIWVLADVHKSDTICDIAWRDLWLVNTTQCVAKPINRAAHRWLTINWEYWVQSARSTMRTISECMRRTEVWRNIRRVQGIYVVLYGVTLIVLVCTKNWLKALGIVAIALSPRPTAGVSLAYSAFRRPSEAIGGTLRAFITGFLAILATNLILHFFISQYRAVKNHIRPVRSKDLQVALSTPSLLVQMMGFKCIIDNLGEVDEHTIHLVRNRANVPRARDSQADSMRPMVPFETAELLLTDHVSMMEIVTRRCVTLLAGAAVVADAIGDVLLSLPKDGVSSVAPHLRDRLKATLRQIKGSRYEMTPRYIALANILEDKAQATINERHRMVFISELRGLLIAILSTAFASLRAFQTLHRVKHLASRSTSAANTTPSSPTKFIPCSKPLNTGLGDPEENVRNESSRLSAALKRIQEIPACPPHSPKVPDFEHIIEHFSIALSRLRLEIYSC